MFLEHCIILLFFMDDNSNKNQRRMDLKQRVNQDMATFKLIELVDAIQKQGDFDERDQKIEEYALLLVKLSE